MRHILQIANSAPFWIFASIIVGIVVFQALIFLWIAKKSAPDAGLSDKEVTTAIRAGFISSIGPSFGIVIVLVSLIALIGSPITLMRIGIIGSAATESSAAAIGASSFGTELGASDFPVEALSAIVWTMFLGGTGWLLFVMLFTKSMGKTQEKIQKSNPKIMANVALAAMLGAFAYLASEQMVTSFNHTIAGILALVSMISMMMLADKRNISWLKEWALGFALVIGMATGYISTFII
ncbi:DUF5058 family protein [Salinicoccus halodurans]|uniref:Translation elongation factor EF-1alpha n=1 Tax=Salinicoccus halodurans TaxID=407035 RepID=A0A0F7HKB5_9STAP|nr:DUF5058 family protein [Salinicoccus halodurans]AKG73593.1 translation elongation factor EF-1alpha [Salinicoccus halodurans]SFK53121.1 protein of unknown function [Salinicoccus halodurans]